CYIYPERNDHFGKSLKAYLHNLMLNSAIPVRLPFSLASLTCQMQISTDEVHARVASHHRTFTSVTFIVKITVCFISSCLGVG
ncbi:hypothetical protein SERLA73DRAFT_136792, partial [Serpula lacrymans var. lacrymans S7.3]